MTDFMSSDTSDTTAATEEDVEKENHKQTQKSSQPEESSSKISFLHNLTPEQKHLIIRAAEIILGVIAVILIIVCIVMLLSDGATVKARVNCPDWSDSATKTELALYNHDAKELLLDDDPSNDPQPKIVSRIQPNEDKVINDIISGGTYTLAVCTMPVLEDGTTFKKPEPQVVEFDGEDIKVEFNLEKEK